MNQNITSDHIEINKTLSHKQQFEFHEQQRQFEIRVKLIELRKRLLNRYGN